MKNFQDEISHIYKRGGIFVNSSIRGAQNRAIGLTFEEVITSACEFYEGQGVAVIEKTPENLRVIKNNHDGTMQAIFEKKAQPDFKGTLDGGKCIIFEAKHTSMDRIQRNVISEMQEKKLDSYEKMGALAYVMVSFQLRNFYRIPWKVFRNMKDIYGRKYLLETELQKYQLKKYKNYILILDGIHYSI